MGEGSTGSASGSWTATVVSPNKARRNAPSRTSRLTGLATNWFMPASRQARTSSGNALAVRAMIGIVASLPPRARISRVAASPSISGICMSMQITS